MPRHDRHRLHLLPTLAASFLLASGCASAEGEAVKPTTRGGQEDAPPATPNATASIASVSMTEDCPHQDSNEDGVLASPAVPGSPASPAAEALDEARGEAEMSQAEQSPGSASRSGPGGNWDQCTQSLMQLSFKSTGAGSANVSISDVRVIVPGKGTVLGTVTARKPKFWDEGAGYRGWNETVPKGADLKASYKLSVPDWSKIETAIGTSSYGFMFVLEVDVEIDGVTQTLRSPEFPREEIHAVVT